MSKKLFVIYMLFFTGILASCQSSKPNEIVSNECLPPLFEFSYPYHEERISENMYTMPSVEGLVLQNDKEGNPVSASKNNFVVKNKDEIWLVEPLVRYTPSTRETKKYTIFDNDQNPIYPGYLFLGIDNTLYVEADNNSYDGIVFARYNEKKDDFEIVSLDNDFLLDGYVGGGHSLVEDKDGFFWFIYKNTLTRFHPNTGKVEQILGEKQGYVLGNTLVSSPKHFLWMVSETLTKTENGKNVYSSPSIISYNIQDGVIENWGAPPDLTRTNWHLYLDSQKHLWINDFGYLDIQATDIPKWHQVIRSPIFIRDNNGNFLYVWARPAPQVETHKRFLWFTFSGLARLDLKTKEWCLITRTPVYNIAKDEDENLWILSNKQLYKYEFQP